MTARLAKGRVQVGLQSTTPMFRRDIQGLRAIAVIAVVLYHAGFPIVRGGYFGVDVFFVVSGFLITGHLLDSAARDGRVRLLPFYARRVRRILPVAWVVAIVTLTASVIVYPPIGLPRVVGDALASMLYIPNLYFAARQTDYLADHSPSPFQHYWSLGVEEQFYLFWPLALLPILLIATRRRWVLGASTAVLLVASLVGGIVMTGIDPSTAFFSLLTRAWELLAGGMLAVGLRSLPLPAPGPRLATFGGALGVAVIAVSVVVFDSQTPVPGAAAIVPVIGTCAVLYFGAENRMGIVGRALGARPVQFVGLISYSLYLVHWPILVLAQVAVGEPNAIQVRTKLFLMLVAIPIAWLLYRFVETPFRLAPRATRAQPLSVVLTAAVITVALASGTVGLTAWATNRTGTLGPAVEVAPSEPLSPPPVVDVAPANLVPQLEDAARSLPDIYADGCHADGDVDVARYCVYGDADATTSIAIFGDSHAAQWLPAIQRYAEDRSIRVLPFTKSACPPQSFTIVTGYAVNTACDRWRADALNKLTDLAPDLVLISSDSQYPLAGGSARPRNVRWAEALTTSIERLREAGSKVLWVADTPRQQVMPASCISAHPREVTRCAAPRDAALDHELADASAEAAVAAGAAQVDLTDYICAERLCPVVVANLLAFRDDHHLTVEFSRYLEPAMAAALNEVLAK